MNEISKFSSKPFSYVKITSEYQESNKMFDYLKDITEKTVNAMGVPKRMIGRDIDPVIDHETEAMVRAYEAIIERQQTEMMAHFYEQMYKKKTPTYEELLGRVKYSLKDIESLIGFLLLCIDDEKTRHETESVFSKWREEEIRK